MIRYERKDIEQISKYRKSIHSQINKYKLDEAGLYRLYQLYDEMFFDGQIQSALDEKLAFSLSGRMTKTAGKTIRVRKGKKSAYEIRISSVIYKDLNKNHVKSVAGIEVSNQIEAIMIIMEHELCHVIEWHNRNTTNCKQKYFKQMANDTFRHTSSYHELTKDKKIDDAQRAKVKIGDNISFEYGGKRRSGIISNINKRATVMVKSPFGRYMDSKKKRYDKYYVPIHQLIINTEN